MGKSSLTDEEIASLAEPFQSYESDWYRFEGAILDNGDIEDFGRAVAQETAFCTHRRIACLEAKLLADNPQGVFNWPDGFDPGYNLLPEDMR